jgi:ADP-dependent NAD(P)H-hydrate dehydratase / NAD(P)H-hydrate epimerase
VLGESRSEARPTGADVGQASDRRSLPSVVLDADALTILSQHPDLFAALHDGCILTPHAGEFARLFPDIAEKLAAPATTGPAYSKVDATRAAAKRAGCMVLFKGPDTVIAAPDGRCSINSAHYDRAAPWLATAGSGDVLAGFITGLLARGFKPIKAAETAAWLHVECARSFGPGLIAEDLPEELPKVFRALGL